MPIPFRCPHCGSQTLVDDCYAGQSGPCAICGKTIAVPYRAGAEGARTDSVTGGAKAGGGKSFGLLLVVLVGGLMAGVAVIGVLLALLLPAIGSARHAAYRSQCGGNLAQIAIAMQMYAADHGSFPPAYIPDGQGRPMHSWRVLLLPYLGEDGLYGQYDFDEPWDGPQNINLLPRMPDVYGCGADPEAASINETTYMVITGPRTLFPGAQTTVSTDMSDAASDTVLLVEVPAEGVSWLEPKDLDFTRMQFLVNGGEGEIGSHHRGGAHVVTADGSSHFLSNDTPAEFLRAMVTIDGSELIPWESIDETYP